jgi:[NiFe] hydrogenase large subunit
VVGGVSCVKDLTPDRIAEFLYITKETQEFVKKVYIPDLLAVASFYKDWGGIGGTTNFHAWGDFPETARSPTASTCRAAWSTTATSATRRWPSRKMSPRAWPAAWYDKSDPLHPWKGKPSPSRKTRSTIPASGDYTWMKAPRQTTARPAKSARWPACWWPTPKGHKEVTPIVNSVLKTLDVPATALFSTLGRTAARGIETVAVGDRIEAWMGSSSATSRAATRQTVALGFPQSTGKASASTTCPAALWATGASSKANKIKNYQYVVPSTWNLGPRDEKGQLGPVEEALIGTPIADPKRPLEVCGPSTAFDPCIACAVHVIDPDSNEVYKVKGRQCSRGEERAPEPAPRHGCRPERSAADSSQGRHRCRPGS